jgi:hypothetical protein
MPRTVGCPAGTFDLMHAVQNAFANALDDCFRLRSKHCGNLLIEVFAHLIECRLHAILRLMGEE